MRRLPGRIVRALGRIGQRLVQSGRWLISGLFHGVTDMLKNVKTWLKKHVWGPIVHGVRSLFGISSPSKTFHGFGVSIIEGLLKGIISKSPGKAVKAIFGGVGKIAGKALGWLANKGLVGLDKLKDLSGAALSGAKSVGGKVAGFVGGVGKSIASSIGGLLGIGGGGHGGSARATGKKMAAAYGWRGAQWTALNKLWQYESGWNPDNVNKSSGAYGIPQALGHGHPFAMGDVPAQIAWGLKYIKGRYDSPLGAWRHELAHNWYGSGLDNGLFTKPTVIGVGERGPERVSVTPANRSQSATQPTIGVINQYLSPQVSAEEVVDHLDFELRRVKAGGRYGRD
jgi:hypothetical protein